MIITKNNSIFVTLKENIELNISLNENILDKLEFYAKFQPNKNAFIQLNTDCIEEESISFANLHKKCLNLSYSLNKLNLSHKQVLLIYNNDIDFIISFLACLASNTIAVPVYIPKSNNHGERLNAIISDCSASAILTTTKLSKLIKSKLNYPSNFNNINIYETDSLLKETPNKFLRLKNINDIAFLQYTSGSTSLPKGVMVSNKNITYNCKYIAQKANINQKSRNLSWLPNYHDMGLFNGFLVLVFNGVTSIIMNPISFISKPSNWLKTISKYNITHTGGPNFAYDLCTEKLTEEEISNLNLSTWICAFNGAENIKSTTLNNFNKKFNQAKFNPKAHFPCYGLAEATLMVTSCSNDRLPHEEHITTTGLNNNQAILTNKNSQNSQELISTGTVTAQTTVKIVNPITLEECDSSSIGEIWISGPTVTKGYWNKEEETIKTFKAKIKNDQSQSYLRTGDLGFLNYQNELFITGRIKEILIINGKNYYPQDIEHTIENASDDIMPHGTAAFQIDKNNTQIICIAVEIKRTKLKTFNKEKLELTIQKSVQKEFELNISDIVFISPMSLPKTSSGKKQRLKARKEYINNTLKQLKSETKTQMENSIKEELTYTQIHVKKMIEDSLKVKNISSKVSLISLGLNSLSSFEIISKINEFFAIEVSAHDFFNTENILQVADIIEQKQFESLMQFAENDDICETKKEVVLA